jgi:hypothetical protein
MMRRALKFFAAGLALAIGVHLIFLFVGTQFFIDGRSPFQVNFVAGAAIGLSLGLLVPALLGAPKGERLAALCWLLIPFLMMEAAVTSHFQTFFRDLNPVMDKVYGALMLWGAAFALIGGLIRR